jgi:flavin reductase (DIM6/NTAB) family NADH-FMN oxidoreductase RutF
MRRRAFTVSIPSQEHVREADYFGVASGKDEDKFARSGLTATPSDRVDAPYVEEFPLVLECNVSAVHELGLHTQFIGEIVDVRADESVLDEKGRPRMEAVRPILFSTGNRAYFGVGEELAPAFEVKEL